MQPEESSSLTAQLADEELLTCSVTEPELFTILVGRYEAAFLRKARGILGGREEADDAVVETFTKIYLNAGRFKKQVGASFNSWAYKILLNTLYTYYQRLRAREERVTGLPDELWQNMTSADDQVATASLKDYVASVMVRLPAETARLLRLYFIEGRPQPEIAQLEGVSVGSIKTRLHRAKKAFKRASLLV